MKDIPADGIYYDDALIIVAEMITPNWQKIVEERLNPAPPHDDAFPERNDKARAKDEVERTYYKALDLAHERLTEKRSQGILVALRRDPKTGEVVQLHRDEDIDRYAPERGGQPVYFDRKPFDNLVREITPPDSDTATHPGENAPTAPKARSKLQARSWDRHRRIREIDDQLRLEGFEGLQKERYDAIRSKFSKDKPSDRTIIRALTPPKSD